MHSEDLNSWAEFKEKVSIAVADTEEKRKSGAGYFSPVLYRGHADANWKLESTLERAGHRFMSVNEYYTNVGAAYRYVSNFGDQRLDFDDLEGEVTWGSLAAGLPNYEFLAYLRHHGFLSPLVDWTQSPYVAAFFAFSDPTPRSEKTAIYVYQEQYGNGKANSSLVGAIRTQGPWASVHERHALQQSWYSYSVKLHRTFLEDKMNETLVFSPHEETLLANENVPDLVQDVLMKFTIPRTERIVALKDLLRMNITPYSLFHSKDAMVATVSMRLFDDLAD